MIKTKVFLWGDRLLSSQSQQSEKFLKWIDWKKVGLPKSRFCFDHAG